MTTYCPLQRHVV